jgi:hypothetical protein
MLGERIEYLIWVAGPEHDRWPAAAHYPNAT